MRGLASFFGGDTASPVFARGEAVVHQAVAGGLLAFGLGHQPSDRRPGSHCLRDPERCRTLSGSPSRADAAFLVRLVSFSGPEKGDSIVPEVAAVYK